MARILVAATESELPRMKAALKGHELLNATTLRQAQRLLNEDGIELFFIFIDFSDSQAIELVKTIRRESHHTNNPIIIARIPRGKTDSLIKQSIDAVSKVFEIQHLWNYKVIRQILKEFRKLLITRLFIVCKMRTFRENTA